MRAKPCFDRQTEPGVRNGTGHWSGRRCPCVTIRSRVWGQTVKTLSRRVRAELQSVTVCSGSLSRAPVQGMASSLVTLLSAFSSILLSYAARVIQILPEALCCLLSPKQNPSQGTQGPSGIHSLQLCPQILQVLSKQKYWDMHDNWGAVI